MSRHSCCCCSNLFQVVILSIQLQCNGAHLLVAAKNVSTPARVMPPLNEQLLNAEQPANETSMFDILVALLLALPIAVDLPIR